MAPSELICYTDCSLCSAAAMNTVLLSNLFSLPRIVYAMAADGLFFQVFARVHPRTQVPVVGILVFGVLMALLALLLDLEALVQFLSIGTLLAYTFVATSIIVLRFQKASPPSSPCLASPGPTAKKYDSFSDHIQLVDAVQTSMSEPGQLRPALKPFLGFLDGCSPGTAVAWALGILVASAISLACVLVFGNSDLHLPQWGYVLLLVISGAVFLSSLLVLGAHQQQKKQDTFQVHPHTHPMPHRYCPFSVLLVPSAQPLRLPENAHGLMGLGRARFVHSFLLQLPAWCGSLQR